MPGFLKRYADAGLAQEALRRTVALRRHGLPTPIAREGTDPDTLVFERIDGRTRRDLIGADMTPLLRVVAALHAATVPAVPAYDPLLRIRPRLRPTDDPLLRGLAADPFPAGEVLLHGDLHVGQFIQEPSGKVWILDLDDLALGPPEADLANFAAHLATTDTGPGIAVTGIAGWARRVCREWVSLGGALEPPVFARFLHLALLRRHLKLREAGRPDFKAQILGYLRESASFSIR